jgi:UDP-2,3-diacylglucosamine pyrophosphatase LpxH
MPASLGRIEFCRRYTFDNRILITHGDDFDNIMARSQVFMKAFRMMHDLRVRLGARPVHVAEYAKKWKAFYRVLRNNVMRNAVNFAAENGFEAVTCGHTHFARPKRHQVYQHRGLDGVSGSLPLCHTGGHGFKPGGSYLTE